MARVLTGNSQNISGKLEDVVYVRRQGKTYIRKAAKKRRDANDPKMVLNQQRFVLITRFCTRFKRIIIPMIWNDRATAGSGYNLFMKNNTPAFAKDGSINDPLLLKFSIGDLPMPETIVAQRIAPDKDTIRVNWQKESHMGGIRLNDELMAISYDGENFSELMPTGIRRREVEGLFDLPALPFPAQYIYLFFAAEDRRSFSESRAFKI